LNNNFIQMKLLENKYGVSIRDRDKSSSTWTAASTAAAFFPLRWG